MKIQISHIAAACAFAATVSCGNAPVDVEGTKTLEADGISVTWIRDNAADRLMERTLFPDASDSLISSLGLQDGIPSTVSVFLLEKDGKKILFDAGLGLPDSRMTGSLKALGVDPEDIDYVYITHFHGDHIGGMVKDGQPVFPDAQVYASQKEYDAWMAMPEDRKAQVVNMFEVYKGRTHLFMPGDVLPCDVRSIDAPGHTPGHTVYQAGSFLVVGDLMHGVALQKDHPDICANYDMDFAAAAATRKAILRYAADNSLTMCGMHFPEPAFILPE